MTQDEIIKLAKQVGMRYREIEDEFYSGYADGIYLDELEAFAKLVAAKEREACAKLCESLPMQQEIDVRDQAATAIRARGQA
jgi:hypothetical protein